MSKLDDAVQAVWDAEEASQAALRANTPVDDTAAGGSETPDTGTETPQDDAVAPPDTTAATTSHPAPAKPSPGQPEAGKEEPSTALIAKTIEEHPELEAALTAKIKELERGYQRKFERLAEERKEVAEAVIKDHTIRQIPAPHLQQMAELYRMATQGNQTERAAAADSLFQLSEQARYDAQSAPTDPYANLDPRLAAELREGRAYREQQLQQTIAAQANDQFAQLEKEYGSISAEERDTVYAEMNRRGIQVVEDIPLMWRGLYGHQRAGKQAQLQQQKRGLGVGGSNAPAPGAPAPPKGLDAALAAVCDEYGVR